MPPKFSCLKSLPGGQRDRDTLSASLAPGHVAGGFLQLGLGSTLQSEDQMGLLIRDDFLSQRDRLSLPLGLVSETSQKEKCTFILSVTGENKNIPQMASLDPGRMCSELPFEFN